MINKKEKSKYLVAMKNAPSCFKQSTVLFFAEHELSCYYFLCQRRRKKHRAKQRKPTDTVDDLMKIVVAELERGKKIEGRIASWPIFFSGYGD